ncbi:LytR/AlgR family response regulator transcription factor [Paenibacillus wulumuqiensis]|uniref:LytR/AlgR family response regulator transcription factor n=1 Tax=Paenibacillus wulumuqiensis TaxID=1567107 RepID=UPI000619F528|nr:LytTR family DNA-binding domain-containing protein [Paenibacillus wulumuqiensis]
MYRVAICDDSSQQREQVRQLLTALSVRTGVEFIIEEFASGELLLQHYEQEQPAFHAWILDVEMPGRSGIETARKLREWQHRDEQIIFLTSYPEYMVDSFDVMTFQYLIKPMQSERFDEVILSLCRYWESQEHKLLVIKSGYDELVIRHDDLIAIEAVKSLTLKNKLHFITARDTYESKGILATYAAALKEQNFLQIHRSVIINMRHAKKFAGNQVLMSNGLELPIGRSRVKEVKDACTRFMIRELN